ncbi:glycerophosphodiester phosphodiesterase [Bacillus sp. H-16]|uniref:glycerophosphodiester phosphodiesterase family protein n=1 Tax=Alteribacter salitolerans TaxID=2912333 RepID=UPI0019659EF9|nr:glycerophosphodiester phosphodiesterase [Alteribacter salitolerans]
MSTLIFAHRGVSAFLPENTMVAFRAAADAGADGIELDVQLTKDEEVVVIHDHTLNRTTTGTGLVREHTLGDLKQLSAGAWYASVYEKEGIPSLRDVLTWAVSNNLLFNIELKCPSWDRDLLAEKTAELVAQSGLEKRIIYSSFDHVALKRIGEIAPEVERAALVHGALVNIGEYVKSHNFDSFHYYFPMLKTEEIEEIEFQGIPVRPYTVNDPEWLAYFIGLNVSGVITDDPELAIRIRNQT